MKKITYKSNFVKQQRQKKNQAKKKMKTKNELTNSQKEIFITKTIKKYLQLFFK